MAMKRTLFVTILLACVFVAPEAMADKREKARAEVLSRSRGYYKEVFMDGGIGLTSRYHLPAARFLGVDMEYYASEVTKRLSQKDTLMQNRIFCGSKNDTNGWLLYPDGAPRYRMIYVNGGKARLHAAALGDEGRSRIQSYVANGGSYLGTCAGAFIATEGSIRPAGLSNTELYWRLCPGYAQSTRLTKSRTAMDIPKKSGLLRYFDFGGDRKVDDVRHNGGCFAFDGEAKPLAAGTEPLALYRFDDTEKVKINGKMAVWGYKASAESGRVVLCGSHPEGVGEGERLEFMSAMMLYAMDGNPQPKIKGVLNRGEVREMNKRTEDNDPAYTRIGDRQYHHFQIEIPRNCKRAVVKLEGYENDTKFDLTLCAKRGEMAFHDNTLLKSVSRGCKKSLTIEKPKAGKWYVSVFCETTVTSHTGKYGTYYRGRVSVLNGVPYKISVEYE